MKINFAALFLLSSSGGQLSTNAKLLSPEAEADSFMVQTKSSKRGKSTKCGKAGMPSCAPSDVPSAGPTVSAKSLDIPPGGPTLSAQPSGWPTMQPSKIASAGPTVSAKPSDVPSGGPTLSAQPSGRPTAGPTVSAAPSCLLSNYDISFINGDYEYTVKYSTGEFMQTSVAETLIHQYKVGSFDSFDGNVAKFENGDECGGRGFLRRGTVTYLAEECGTNAPILVSFIEDPICAYHAVIKGLCCSAAEEVMNKAKNIITGAATTAVGSNYTEMQFLLKNA